LDFASRAGSKEGYVVKSDAFESREVGVEQWLAREVLVTEDRWRADRGQEEHFGGRAGRDEMFTDTKNSLIVVRISRLESNMHSFINFYHCPIVLKA
jgi:hypothetical protein